MTHNFLEDECCVDLLILQAMRGLDPTESLELESLLVRYPGIDHAVFESAVGALTLAGRGLDQPLPAALRARLLAQSEVVASNRENFGRGRSTSVSLAPPTRRSVGVASWWLAAAATVIAIVGWYPRLTARPPPQVAAGAGAIHWVLAGTSDPGGVGASGEVLFDPVTQHGHLRFHQLKSNDPKQYQYQLWIFDGERDQRYPVDGGVFDIPPGSEGVLIPITARVRVGRPVLFAVTLERPGGVVVSAREHIVAVAKPAGA